MSPLSFSPEPVAAPTPSGLKPRHCSEQRHLCADSALHCRHVGTTEGGGEFMASGISRHGFYTEYNKTERISFEVVRRYSIKRFTIKSYFLQELSFNIDFPADYTTHLSNGYVPLLLRIIRDIFTIYIIHLLNWTL